MKDNLDNDNVAFDPGYCDIAFSFTNEIAYLTQNFNKLKNLNQKRFELSKIETPVINIINKTTAFYLGCILWGGFLHYKYLNNPKNIVGNHILTLSEEEKKDFDCAVDIRTILAFIELFDRDCKYYLKHSAKIQPVIFEILNSYIEFAKINNNFLNTTSTKDIKIPKIISHFENHREDKLDELRDKIYSIIQTKDIGKILEIDYFK